MRVLAPGLCVRTHRRDARWPIAALALALWAVPSQPALAESPLAHAGEPLHARIDQLVEANHAGRVAPPAPDADFLRRAYLDLAGRVPSIAEARAFLADAAADKRAGLVERLLASGEFVAHMTDVFDVMLMERRPERAVKIADWRGYLYDSLAANKPLDQLAREILAADGADAAPRPAVRFYLDRDADVYALARDVGRMFFGRDMQCAQCHDHPLIDDYVQADYYGLIAFLNRSYAFTDKDKKEFFAEKAEGDITFQSVFTKTSGQTGPRLPGGEPQVEPSIPPGQEYVVAPAKDVRPVPKHSRKALLAAAATGGQSRAFNRNLANRLWALLMGQGLVEPVDLDHSGNPPSNPALLELLTDELPAMKYDLRAFLRELALTNAYGRAIELPADLAGQSSEAAARLAGLESQCSGLQAALVEAQPAAEKARGDLSMALQGVVPVAGEIGEAEKGVAAAQKTADEAGKAATTVQSELTSKQDIGKSVAEAAAKGLEAAAKLPQDQELAQAAEKFKVRSESIAGEVAAATKALDEKTAAAKSAGDALAATRQAASAVAAKLQAAREQVIAAGKEESARLATLRGRDAAASAAAARVADAKALVEYGRLLTAVDARRIAVDRAQADVAQARAALANLLPEQARLAEALAGMQKTSADLSAALAAAQQVSATKKPTVDALAEALAKSELAAGQLAGDAELAQAIATLKSKLAQTNADLQAANNTVGERTAAAQAGEQSVAAAQAAIEAHAAKMAAATAQLAAAEQAAKAAALALAAERAAADAVLADIGRRYVRQNAAAALRPLAPEQLAASVMQVTGVVDQQRAAAAAEWAKTRPDVDVAQLEPLWAAARTREIEQATRAKLQDPVAAFVRMFAAGAGQPQSDFFATADQALFVANGGLVRGWLAPAGDNLTARLGRLTDERAVAEELYLSVLTRPPTDAETADAAAYLAARTADRPVALQELAWALIASAEFRFIR